MPKKHKNLKISIGIFVGYCLGTLLNVIFFEKDIVEAILDKKLLFLFAGIILIVILIKKKTSL